MLCNEYKRVVYFFLDGSLGSRKIVEFESHRELCPDCESRITIHRKLRDFIRKRLAPVSAPERLKMRLVQSLRVAE